MPSKCYLLLVIALPFGAPSQPQSPVLGSRAVVGNVLDFH